jgi:hypothetical protein
MKTTFFHRKRIFTLLLTFVTTICLSGQVYKGKILDSSTGETVPFVNVIVDGTDVGIATNQDGEFTIDIPKEFQDSSLSISALGYVAGNILISTLNTKKVNVIMISPTDYSLEGIEIQADSKVLYGVLRKCIDNATINYTTSPYSCKFTFQQDFEQENNASRFANGIYSDSKGYNRTAFKVTFESITYKFVESDSSHKNPPYFEGKSNMEDLLSFDIVRGVGNVLDEKLMYDYDLNYDLSDSSLSIPVWVIHFSLREPSLYTTGDPYCTAYEGELYISKSDYAIVKSVVRGKSTKRSIHGRSVHVDPNSSVHKRDVEFIATSTYEKVDGRYQIGKIVLEESYTTLANKRKTTVSSFTVTDQLKEFVAIKGRDYFVPSYIIED